MNSTESVLAQQKPAAALASLAATEQYGAGRGRGGDRSKERDRDRETERERAQQNAAHHSTKDPGPQGPPPCSFRTSLCEMHNTTTSPRRPGHTAGRLVTN